MTEKQFSERALACAERLHRISYLILGREADCEDAVQEALMRAWLNMGRLRDEAYFETWLIRILINESKRILRGRARHPSVEIPESLPAPDPPDPALRDAVLSLDSGLRIPIVLHYLEGYGMAEIAAMLGLPESTIKYRLRRGRELLRQRLGEDEPEERT